MGHQEPHRPAVVALDVGGTLIKGAVLGEEGVLVQELSPTNAGSGPQASIDATLQALRRLIDRVPATHRALGVGLVVPGTVDENAGVVVSAENLDWVDLPLVRIAEEAVGLPVTFGHDVRTAGLAEWHLGAGDGATDLGYVSIGTGIAAALIINGRLVTGHGYAGEIGHGGAKDGEPCACGGRGCAETFASAGGIARRYFERSGVRVPGAKEVLAAASAGDPIAQAVWDDAVDHLGLLISELVRVTGLSTVVIGGGLVRAGDQLMVPLASATAQYLTVHPVPQLVPARLGSDAGMFGAGLLAWQTAALPPPAGWRPAAA